MALTLHYLANLYKVEGRTTEAEALYRRALEIREKKLSPLHPDIAETLSDYAGLLRATGRAAEAEKMEERVKAIRTKFSQNKQ